MQIAEYKCISLYVNAMSERMTLQTKHGVFATFMTCNATDTLFQNADIIARSPPVDSYGRHLPEGYVRGLQGCMGKIHRMQGK